MLKEGAGQREKRITDLETSINYNEDDVAKLQKNLYDHRAQLDKCKKDLLYLEAYSRRENVKIFGVPQATGNENASEPENTNESGATLKAGMTERRNDGMAESRNGGKYPQILKEGMTENHPKS